MTQTPDAGVPRTVFEQERASSGAASVEEAARQITSWSGRATDTASLAALAEGVLPSVFRRAVDNLTRREAAEVRQPLALLPSLIADEVARSDDF